MSFFIVRKTVRKTIFCSHQRSQWIIKPHIFSFMFKLCASSSPLRLRAQWRQRRPLMHSPQYVWRPLKPWGSQQWTFTWPSLFPLHISYMETHTRINQDGYAESHLNHSELFLLSPYFVQAGPTNYLMPKWKTIKRPGPERQGMGNAHFQNSSSSYDLWVFNWQSFTVSKHTILLCG